MIETCVIKFLACLLYEKQKIQILGLSLYRVKVIFAFTENISPEIIEYLVNAIIFLKIFLECT